MGQRPIDQPGLRVRMGRERLRISSQHRQLDSLYEMIRSALEQGSESAAQRAFERFADAFDAHTSLEDGFYFPAVRAMHPGVGDELDELIREHETFRRELESLAALFRAGRLGECDEPLDAFVVAVARHEGREESLLERITARG